MPQYRVRDNASGREVVIEWQGAAPPTDADVAQVFETARDPMQTAEPLPAALPSLPGVTQGPIPDPAAQYGASPEWSAGGFARNVGMGLARAPVQIARTGLDLARVAAGDTRPIQDVGQALMQMGQDVSQTYQREGFGAVAQDALIGAADFAYQNPVEAGLTARGVIPGLRRIPTPGQAMAGAAERVLRRDPAKLLRKIEERNTPILKPTEYAQRNNPDKNFALITAREGAEMGFTKGAKGIVSKEGERALAAKEELARDLGRGMQQASTQSATIRPALRSMRGVVQATERTALDPTDAAAAARHYESARANPAYNWDVYGQAPPVNTPSAILGPNGQPLITPGFGPAPVVGHLPKKVPVEQLARARQSLKDANNAGPAFRRAGGSEEAVRRADLAAQGALKTQEHALLNKEFGTPDAPTPYTDVQKLRSDIIPTRRVLRQALNREQKKSPWIGWRAGAFQLPGFGTGAMAGTAVAGPIGGVIGGIAGTIGGRKLMNYFDSPGYQSAKASRYYQQMQTAPQWNAALAREAATAAPALDAVLVERAMRDAVLEQLANGSTERPR